MRKLGDELSVADPELFVALATENSAIGREAKKHGGSVHIGGHRFFIVPQIVECSSKLGIHELKPGFVGHVESSIYLKDQGGDAKPQLQISIIGAEQRHLVTAEEHSALDALAARVRKIAMNLHL